MEFVPLGVIGAIVPWNYPFHNVFNPVSAALFSGNSIVIKVSEYASWSIDYYKRIIDGNNHCHCHCPCPHPLSLSSPTVLTLVLPNPLSSSLSSVLVLILCPHPHSVVITGMLSGCLDAIDAPRDLVQFVVGYGATGSALVTSGVDKLIFVGSPSVGNTLSNVYRHL